MVSATSPSSIDSDTLRQFTAQLCHWAESLISRGRSPLRKVETFPALLTVDGEKQPPLLFWINRDSCMAGGVVLFPTANDAAALKLGHHCAQALGLRYFVTWTRSELSFWDDTDPPQLRKQIPLGKGGRADTRDFQEALQLLLEEVKLLSVLAAVPPPDLSPCYLANLWRNTLLAIEPLLCERYRVARGEQHLGEDDDPKSLAVGKGYLTLARLLALMHHDLLPAEIPPAQLEAELGRALPVLPPGLRASLALKDSELPLPEAAAIRLHLLLRRLTQLRPAGDLQRLCQALDLLLANEHRRLGGFAPPFPLSAGQATLLLNPDRSYQTGTPALEFAPPPLLAMLALQRSLCGQPAVTQTASLWQAPEHFVPSRISGTLADWRLPSAERRHHFLALLRRSWPNRRFRLPVGTPVWSWQLLHVLGMAAPAAQIEVRLPDGWLTSPYGQVILELVQNQFVLDSLAADGSGWLNLRLLKSAQGEGLSTLLHEDRPRTLDWSWLRHQPPALIALALYLPQPLFALLEDCLLRAPSAETWPAASSEAIFAYSRAPLGQLFWQLLGDGRPLPRRSLLQKELLRCGMPLPSDEVLARLQRAMTDNGSDGARQKAFDRELSLWLGRDLPLPLDGPGQADLHPASATAAPLDPQPTAEEIAREVFIDGIPLFPEHYLYDYYRPELRLYDFALPLFRGGEFFGRVELVDGQGKRLELDNEDTAKALQLCAAAGQTSIALPADAQIIAAIVQRYLDDLRHLHQDLARTCHRRCSDPQAADTLVAKIWSNQPLPDWPTLLEIDS